MGLLPTLQVPLQTFANLVGGYLAEMGFDHNPVQSVRLSRFNFFIIPD